MFELTGSIGEPQALVACVLFDPANGTVAHIHGAATLAGGQEPAEAEIEARARAAAGRHGRRTEHLEALHVDASELPRGHRISVDADQRRIRAEPI